MGKWKKSPVEREEGSNSVRVQATNDESVVSKASSIACHYIEDPFLEKFVQKPVKRSSLINRGYYVRMYAIRDTLSKFSRLHDGDCQVVSIGAGFDSTFFALRRGWQGSPVTFTRYYELDYPDVVKRKIIMTRADPDLYEMTGEDRSTVTKETEMSLLSSSRYHIMPCDLREIEELERSLADAGLDFAMPTLFLSECVLTYIEPLHTNRVVSWVGNRFARAAFVTYEQIKPSDMFGEVMMQRLKSRSSPLLCIQSYPTKASKLECYKEQGWKNVEAMDMNELHFQVLGTEELERVEALETFDEHEDYHTTNGHYVVLLATKGMDNFHLSERAQKSPHVACTQLPSSETTTLTTLDMDWNDAPPRGYTMPPKRCGQACATARIGSEECVVMFGGYSARKLSDLWVMDSNYAWTEVAGPPKTKGKAKGAATSPHGRCYHTLSTVGDAVYLFGGRDSPERAYNDVWRLQIGTSPTATAEWTWTLENSASSSLPEGRFRHTSVPSNDGFIVFGGVNRKGVLGDWWCFSTKDLTWTSIVPTGHQVSARYSHSMVQVPSKSTDQQKTFLLVGGTDNQRIYGDVIEVVVRNLDDGSVQINCANVSTHTSSPDHVPSPRYSAPCVIVERDGEDHLLVGGGNSCDTEHEQTVFALRLRDNHWVPVACPRMSGSLWVKHSLVSYRQKVLFICGGLQCFSFGSHFNPAMSVLKFAGDEPVKFSVDPALSSSANTPAPNGKEKSANGKHEKKPRKDGPSHSNAWKQRRSVPVLVDPTAEEVLNLVENTREPCILRGDTLRMRELSRAWTPKYITDACGDKLVSIHSADTPLMDFTKRNFKFETIKLRELVAMMGGTDDGWSDPAQSTTDNDSPKEYVYLRSIGENARKQTANIIDSFSPLGEEFEEKIPEYLRPYASHASSRYFSSVLRMSSKGLHLWTHFDVMDNILVQVTGRKRVRLWAPSQLQNLYVSESSSRVINVDEPNLSEFPRFARAKNRECILEPGDVLFLPALWFHHVVSLEASISINVFWRHLSPEMYEKKDLYGNKDPTPARQAEQDLEKAMERLQSLPSPYSEFYAYKLVEKLKAAYNL